MANYDQPKRRKRGKGEAHSCECGNHVWAPLTKGHVTYVSPEFAPLLRKTNWCANKSGYAFTSSPERAVYLHRVIKGSQAGQIVDHVNFNKSDNRSENLRHVDPQQNVAWRRKYTGNFKGTKPMKKSSKWTARISVSGKERYLGCFTSREEAALAYNEAAKKHFGEFAVLNEIGVG